MLNGCSLFWSLHRIKLGTKTRGLLTMSVNFALQAGAGRFFAAERRGGVGRLAFGCAKGCLCLHDFVGQGAQLLSEAGSAEFDGLELDEAFDVLVHA